MKKIVFSLVIFLGILLAFQFTKPNEATLRGDIVNAKDGVVLLELFTSQGCSSCPPADKLLDKTLAENTKVIGVSYHVDYWNYIGWKDPFSAEEYTNYQRAYASKFNSESIYTPQLVLNGKTHFTGSDSRQLYRRLSDEANYLPGTLKISTIKRERNTINFELISNKTTDLLTAVLVIEQRQTEVTRGENRNRDLTNSNIVIAREVMANIGATSVTMKVPKFVKTSDQLKIIAFSQNQDLQVQSVTQKTLKQ